MIERLFDISSLLEETQKVSYYLYGALILVILIIFVILTVRIGKSLRDASEANLRINQYFAAIPESRIGTVSAIYNQTKKDLGHALLLSLFFGPVGAHHLYMGNRKAAWSSFFFFWTGIPAVCSLFDAVNMPMTVANYNLQIAEDLYNQIAAPETPDGD